MQLKTIILIFFLKPIDGIAAIPSLPEIQPLAGIEVFLSSVGFIVLPIMIIVMAFNVMSRFNDARMGDGEFSSVGIAAIVGVAPLVFLSFLLDVPGGTVIIEKKEAPISFFELLSDLFSVFGYIVLAVVIISIIIGIVVYFNEIKKSSEKSNHISEGKEKKIDKRFFQLRNKSEKLAKSCDKEGIREYSPY